MILKKELISYHKRLKDQFMAPARALTMRPFAPHDIVKKALAKIHIPDLVKLIENYSKDTLLVSADEEALTEVMVNLLKNAIDACGRDGGTVSAPLLRRCW